VIIITIIIITTTATNTTTTTTTTTIIIIILHNNCVKPYTLYHIRALTYNLLLRSLSLSEVGALAELGVEVGGKT
jgi:hypothetical protein